MKVPVKLYEGSYENIKITTPEDLEIAKVFLAKRKEKYHKQFMLVHKKVHKKEKISKIILDSAMGI